MLGGCAKKDGAIKYAYGAAMIIVISIQSVTLGVPREVEIAINPFESVEEHAAHLTNKEESARICSQLTSITQM